jgi:hypothetical protein
VTRTGRTTSLLVVRVITLMKEQGQMKQKIHSYFFVEQYSINYYRQKQKMAKKRIFSASVCVCLCLTARVYTAKSVVRLQ